MKNLFNTIKKTLTLGLLSASLVCSNNVRAEDTVEFSGVHDVGWKVEMPTFSKISNVPLRLRDVPGHVADSYPGDPRVGPIEPDYIDTEPSVFMIDQKIGGRIDLGKSFSLGAGFGLCLDMLDVFTLGQYNVGKNGRERNYLNDPGSHTRGVGAALTGYSVYPSYFAEWNTFIQPYLYGEAELKINDKLSVAAGCNLRQEEWYFVTFYDRYNELKVKDREKIYDAIVAQPYVSARYDFGWDWGKDWGKVCLFLDVGKSQVISGSPFASGSEMDFKSDAGWFARIGVQSKTF
jgi:hypothetical protein